MDAKWDTIAWQTEFSEEGDRLAVTIEAILDDLDEEMATAFRDRGVQVTKITLEPDVDGTAATDRSR